jgi:hypothetical protein
MKSLDMVNDVWVEQFDLVAPGCIGMDGASDCSEELEGEEVGCKLSQ